MAMARATWHELGTVRSGDHVILIYDDTPELTAFVVPFVKAGLAKGERCLYVVDDLELAEVTEALAQGSVDVQREIERGALSLMNAQEYYPLQAHIQAHTASRLIELHLGRFAEATSRGFTGLRIAAEMTWVHTMGIRDDDLLEAESVIEEAIGTAPLTAACMYRRDRFPPAFLHQMLRSHAKVIARDHVYLSLSALFQNLARSDLQGLLQSAGARRKRKGEFYFHQGEQATEVFVLTQGKVKLVRTDPDGREVILRIIAPPDSFGDRAALGGTTRLASAQALEPSRALVWDGPTLLQAMMRHPTVSLNAVRLVEQRLEEELDRLQDVATSPVERRLARLLLRFAQAMGRKTTRGVALELPLSGKDLADLVITTPYTVSRILAEWRRLGIVDAQRERILVLDEPRIAAIAGVDAREDLPPAS